ncbi:transferase [Streptomyces sp. NPDC091272]|uniref:transferase n=1 Tax=Streptomyces sp. NPDC091272 TaxID=3365981 RepID=UPI003825A806
MTSSSSRPPTAPAGRAGTQVPPRADCTADSAGGITFDVAAAAAPDAALVLRRTGGTGGDDVRLPLTPVAHGRLRAVLPSTVDLPEGRWETRVHGGGADLTVRPGLRDLRALVDRRPDPRTEAVAVRIPYATPDGRLAVRSWRRSPHAEAGDITFGQDGATMTVEGRLYGIEAGRDTVVEARLRGERDRVHREPVTAAADGAEHSFAFTLPYASLDEGRDGGARVWDLWLSAADGAPPIRVARLLDDIAEKQPVLKYPVLPVGDSGKSVAFPYFTLDNDLAVQVSTP